jgi:hypothetical protein
MLRLDNFKIENKQLTDICFLMFGNTVTPFKQLTRLVAVKATNYTL